MKIVLLLAFIGLCTAGLRDRANRIYIGVALNPVHYSTPLYNTSAYTEFNSVTAEWQMKWDPIGNNPNQPNFDYGEAVMQFAAQHQQSVRGHALIWHSATPTWVHALENNPTELQRVIDLHINDTMTHFRGRCKDWDVVNEAFVDDGSLRDTIFTRVFGDSYIARAFRLAHAADPTAKLYYNDYSIEGINAKSNAIFNLLQRLLAEGVPIHGIGFQAHFIIGQVPATFVANMQRFANLGLDVAITELDIRMNTPPTHANLVQQANDYAATFNACFQVPRCLGITVWGVTDLYSWIPSTFPGQGAALLLDENFARKQAYYSVESVIH